MRKGIRPPFGFLAVAYAIRGNLFTARQARPCARKFGARRRSLQAPSTRPRRTRLRLRLDRPPTGVTEDIGRIEGAIPASLLVAGEHSPCLRQSGRKRAGPHLAGESV